MGTVGEDNKVETSDHRKVMGDHVGLGYGNVKEMWRLGESPSMLQV